MRFELPPGLSPEEERAVLAALEQYLREDRPRASPWRLAARAEALRLGALQTRRASPRAWTAAARGAYSGGAPESRGGRGDTR